MATRVTFPIELIPICWLEVGSEFIRDVIWWCGYHVIGSVTSVIWGDINLTHPSRFRYSVLLGWNWLWCGEIKEINDDWLILRLNIEWWLFWCCKTIYILLVHMTMETHHILLKICDLLCNLIFFMFGVSRESNVDSHWKFSKREVILKYQQ